MKKQEKIKQETKKNEAMSEVKTEVVKTRKPRAQKLFFLYVNGKGFIRLDKQAGAGPNFTDGEILSFNSKTSAIYARDFFINIGFAEEISIFAKIA